LKGPNRHETVSAVAKVPAHTCFFCGHWPNRRRLVDLEKAPKPIKLCYRCVETLLAARGDSSVCSFCAQGGRKTRGATLRGGAYGAKICDKCIEEVFRDEHGRKRAYELDARVLGIQPPFGQRRLTVFADRVFYLGPFREPYNSIYRSVVSPAVKANGFSIKRADEIYATRPVMQDVWQGIGEAGIIIAEVTGRNANVMYEVGIAHTIGKPVILITQDIGDVPFDLRHYRCITYRPNARGFQQLKTRLQRTLTDWVRNRAKPQSGDRRLPSTALERPRGEAGRHGRARVAAGRSTPGR